jgi:hypothetical protein
VPLIARTQFQPGHCAYWRRRAKHSAWPPSASGKSQRKCRSANCHCRKTWPAGFTDALAPNVEVLALERDVVIEAMRLPEFPTRDPVDELIVASARVHNLTLLPTDTKLKAYRHAHVHYFKPLGDRTKM